MTDEERDALIRLLDVNANRAAEALRTAEEYIRFFLENRRVTALSREIRHELGNCVRSMFPDYSNLRVRDTSSDVAAGPTLVDPGRRTSARDVCSAAFFRLKESLRTLEEYSKLLNPEISRRFEKLRYRVYDLEADTLTAKSEETSDS